MGELLSPLTPYLLQGLQPEIGTRWSFRQRSKPETRDFLRLPAGQSHCRRWWSRWYGKLLRFDN